MLMNWRSAAVAAVIATMPWVVPAAAQQKPAREYLRIQERCYPVAIDPTNEEINTVCRGDAGWRPDGLQLFNEQTAEKMYFNSKANVGSWLEKDIQSGVGPVPWFQNYWLPLLDRNNLPRPR
jgi:hypothetical protein